MTLGKGRSYDVWKATDRGEVKYCENQMRFCRVHGRCWMKEEKTIETAIN